MKEQVIDRIKGAYEADPAYLFRSNPHTAVFRLSENGKWFAVLIGNLPACKLGLKGENRVDILNVKCDPDMAFAIVDHKHIFPAYHMNKLHWISILLDGKTPLEEISFLVAASHRLVSVK